MPFLPGSDYRFAAWFPLPEGGADPDGAGHRPDRVEGAPAPAETPAAAWIDPGAVQDDIDAAVVALSTVAEVVSELGGTDLGRQADAIQLMERLLPDARLSPARYQAVLRQHPGEVRPALWAVHQAAGFRARGGPPAEVANRKRQPRDVRPRG